MADFNADDPIVVVDYDPAWPQVFERERAQIAAALGDIARSIEHVGSTAVPGLRAKPVIDILVAVAQHGPADEIARRLAPLGYEYRPHDDDAVRLFFLKRSPRRYHLHVVEQGSWEHRRHVLFRDMLRARPEIAREYAVLKAGLAAQFRDQREAYTEGKSDFIRAVVARAEQEERRE